MSDEVAEAGVDLAELLQNHARAAHVAEDSQERVSTTVQRVSGFRHRATGGHGHSWGIDEPVTFGGGGTAADPAEMLLAAVAASLSVTLTAHAALRGISICDLRVESEGEMDALAFFFPGQGAPGLTAHRMRVVMRSAEGHVAVSELLADAVKASPVLRALASPPEIRLQLMEASYDAL